MTYCIKSALNLQLLDNFMLTEENDFHRFNSMCSGELRLTLSIEYFIPLRRTIFSFDWQVENRKGRGSKRKHFIVLPQENDKFPSGPSLTLTWNCSVWEQDKGHVGI